MGMSEFYGPSDEEENLTTLNHSIDVGCTFIDTSDVYGVGGANEKLIAKVLKTRRSEVFLCTKFGIVRNEEGVFGGYNSSPSYVKQCCQNSLNRLGIDCIDLYYQHRLDSQTPIEDTVKAMAELVQEGKVKYLGLSEASAATIRRAHAVHPISAYQVEYSPWSVDIELDDRLAVCKELGIAVVAYSPLGRGFLTGEIKSPDDLPEGDWRRTNPRFQAEAFVKNLELVESLKALAVKKGVTVAQFTLAWVLAQSPIIIPIPGTRKVSRLDENWGAKDVQITAEDNEAVRNLIDTITVVGDRYSDMRAINI